MSWYRCRAGSVFGALLLGAALGCVEETDPPPGDDDTVPQEIPDCEECHDLSDLTTPISGEAPREWTAIAGRGLTRKTVLIPAEQTRFEMQFPRRGHHAEEDLGECTSCHPISSQGLRHGMRQYPLSMHPDAFAAETDCASSCHLWLDEDVTSTGFAPESGDAPVYSGSLAPHELLSGVETGHTLVYREGYVRGDDSDISTGVLKPGCAGCHNLRNDQHGTVTNCLDCHLFGGLFGDLHQLHYQTIEEHRATVDPEHADQLTCNYCHGLDSDSTDLKNSSCYGCHLSGHQPQDAGDQAHFWPTAD